MSSTNRGGRRNEADFYPTPAWCVRRLLEAVALPGGQWLEPTAGTGAIIEAVNSERADVAWHAVELDRKSRPELVKAVGARRVKIDNFLYVSPNAYRQPPSVIITNPPFSCAMGIIEHALEFGPEFVVMLLRLNFLATDGRAEFMRRHAPDVYVLPNRPSFSGAGTTDSIEYAWFVWHGAKRRSRGRMQVLAPTPRSERNGSGCEDD